MASILYILRLLIIFLIVIIGISLLYNIFVGIKSGKLKYRDTSTIVVWNKNPIKFLFILLIQLFLALVSFITLYKLIGSFSLSTNL